MSKQRNDGLQTEEVLFKVDPQVKLEFLNDRNWVSKKSTRKFYTYVLGLADEFEQKIGRSIYNFNIEDRDELLLVQYKNKNKWTVQSNLTPLKKYVDFCILKNLVQHNRNRFAEILTDDYENYVNLQAVEHSYISKFQIREMQKYLINDQDKLILELPSWGIRGRTKKGCTLEELINLKVKEDIIDQGDVKQLIVTKNNGEFRHVDVDDYTIDLIKRVIGSKSYIFNNGYKVKKNEEGEYEKTNRAAVINETEYVFRIPGKNKFGKATPGFFASRIEKMQQWLEKPFPGVSSYLTVSNLFFSSMIDFAKKLKDEKGELTTEDYEDINAIFEFGIGKAYIPKTKDLVNTYLVGK